MNWSSLFKPSQKQIECLYALRDYRYVLFGGARGGGKLIDKNTPICLINGWTTMGEIRVNDTVFDKDGKPCKVIAKSEPEYDTTYRLTFSDGSVIVCGASHQWITETKSDRVNQTKLTDDFRKKRRETRPSRGTGKRPDLALRNSTQKYEYKDIPELTSKTTQEIVDTLVVGNGEHNHAILTTKPIDLPERKYLIPPYVLGAWLGDGAKGNGQITGIDYEIFEQIELEGYKVTHHKSVKSHNIGSGFSKQIKEAGVFRNKHIPQEYLRGSVEQRLSLLQGLMDTDGYVDVRGHCSFTNTNKDLVDGVYELIVSLGIKTTIHEGRAKLYGKDCGAVYDMCFMTDLPAFRLKRKLERQKTSIFNGVHKRRYIVDAIELPPQEMQCIEVDSPSKTYLVGKSMIPTHNSYLLRWWLLQSLIEYYKVGLPNVRVLLACESYPVLQDRQVSKINIEFPRWLGEVKKTQTDGLGFYLKEEFGGGAILLRNLDEPGKYMGAEFAAIGIDQIEKIPVDTFNVIRGSLRWVGVKKPRLLGTANPGGMPWVKQYWIDHVFPKELEDRVNEFAFVQSLPSDNAYLDPSYWEDLNSLPDRLRKAWVEGDWGVFSGQAFPLWDENRHTCEPFEIPDNWIRFRGIDWGYTKPFACVWLAKEPSTGRVYLYRELVRPKLTDRYQARLIKDMTPPQEHIAVTYADPSMWNTKNMADVVSSTDNEYMHEGVYLTKADNSRLNGKRKIDRLMENLPDGRPGFIVFNTCKDWIHTFPYLMLNEEGKGDTEDVQTDSNDHEYDAVRYGLTSVRSERLSIDIRKAVNPAWSMNNL